MISIIPKADVSAKELKQLKSLTTLSYGDLKAASQVSRSICNIKIFGHFNGLSDTERQKLLILIATEMNEGMVPYRVFEIYDHGDQEELDGKALISRILHWRAIEIEQQMASDLENGFIKAPEEFEPHDEDWTKGLD